MKKLRRTRRWSHMIQVMALSLVLIMGLGTVAMAGNVSDTRWGYDENGNAHYYTSSGQTHTETLRAKEDDTSTYMYMTGGSLNVIRFVIMGKNYYTGAQANCTGPSISNPFAYYEANKNAAYANRFFMNTVNEQGYGWSFLYTYSVTNGTATGLWSPDSVY